MRPVGQEQPVRHRLLRRHRTEPAAHLRRQWNLRAGPAHRLLALPLRSGCLHRYLQERQRLRSRQLLRVQQWRDGRDLRTEEQRPDLQRGQRLPIGQLRGRRLLRERLPRGLPELRPARLARPMHRGGSRLARPARHLRRQGRQLLRPERTLRRQGLLPNLPDRDDLRSFHLHAGDVHGSTNLQCGRPVRAPTVTGVQSLHLQRATCFGSCTQDSECVAPATCVNGSCGKKLPGSQCSSAGECQSGFCAQGVCCNSACTGDCQACAFFRQRGQVHGGPRWPRPDGEVSVQRQLHLRPDGRLPGWGVRVLLRHDRLQGSQLRWRILADPRVLLRRSRELRVPVPEQLVRQLHLRQRQLSLQLPERQQLCATHHLREQFLRDEAERRHLRQQLPVYQRHCTSEGVCCNSACTDGSSGLCMSCKVANRVGTCSPVPSGQSDPKQGCKASGCSNSGWCDGNGACAPAPTSTACGTAGCSSTDNHTLNNVPYCDGKGNCSTPSTTPCAPYQCSGSSCLSTCTLAHLASDCVRRDVHPDLRQRVHLRHPGRDGKTCLGDSDCTAITAWAVSVARAIVVGLFQLVIARAPPAPPTTAHAYNARLPPARRRGARRLTRPRVMTGMRVPREMRAREVNARGRQLHARPATSVTWLGRAAQAREPALTHCARWYAVQCWSCLHLRRHMPVRYLYSRAREGWEHGVRD